MFWFCFDIVKWAFSSVFNEQYISRMLDYSAPFKLCTISTRHPVIKFGIFSWCRIWRVPSCLVPCILILIHCYRHHNSIYFKTFLVLSLNLIFLIILCKVKILGRELFTFMFLRVTSLSINGETLTCDWLDACVSPLFQVLIPQGACDVSLAGYLNTWRFRYGHI